MTPEETVDRAARAQRLREDRLLTEAFDGVKAAWLDALLTSAYGQAELREHCYRNIAALEEVKGALFRFVQDGKIAAAEIEAREKKAKARK